MAASKTQNKGSLPQTSPQAKLKQSSLLSFFSKKPVSAANKPKEIATPANSSPLRGQNAPDDKENEQPKPLAKPTTPEKSSLLPNTPQSDSKKSSKSASPLEAQGTGSPVASGRRAKRITYVESSDEEADEETFALSRGKVEARKRRKVVDDEEEDDEFVPDANNDPSEDEDMKDDEFVVPDDFEEDEVVEEEEEVAVKKKSKKNSPPSSILASKFNASSSYASSSPIPLKPAKKSSSAMTPQKKFVKENEERYQWLINIKDADGRPESDPEYDPRTLYIPKSAWAKFTAFEKQYWEIKSKFWDSIVFFKKGKFYELYEKDADVAHQKFDLKLAGTGRANMRLAGIPEMSFDFWAKKFIDDGFKVAKVDQKESLLAKEIREKNAVSKEDKVIKRELSCVLTCGTLTDEGMLTDEMSKYCLSLKEMTNNDGSKIFGVCFVDTATGKMQLTEFEDDAECNKLETLLAQIQPMEVLVEKSKVSSHVMKLVKYNAHPGAIFSSLKSGDEFWDHDTAFEQLTRGKYFEAKDLDDLSHYPALLVEYYEKEKNVGFSAFGGLLWYLKSLKLDESIISMGNIEQYDPFKSNFADSTMRLNGVTLQNLEIFSNSFDQSDKGTLFKLLNRATTPFGKRMFRNWVVHPLMSLQVIESRLDSVETLMNDGDLRSLLETKFSKLPDLERLLARIHAGNLKVKEFAKCVAGFESIASFVGVLKSTYAEDGSKLGGELGRILKSFPAGLTECVNQWLNAFDRDLAAQEGIIVPEKGVEPEFDESNNTIKELEKELNKLLSQYRRDFKCQEMCFKDSGKEIFLIEVPSKAVSRIPKDWQQMAATAKCKRYWSPVVKSLVRQLMEARELHKILCESLQQKMYAKFDQDYETWSLAIKMVAQMDCILSLARSSESLGSPMCRPEFIEGDRAQVEFKELRHPCFIPGGASGTKDFIPNDISLGVDDKNHIGLLTGANAAGKSTLLRMTCVAVIMAQIGCFVPATSARLTPIDSIMTRLGANDNIMQGKSTFFVELSETKRILETSTPRSLIILDELGRGGSSSDGFAIAEAVLHHIATHIQSIGFFATHYATLGNSFLSHPRITPLRMGIIVDEESRNITFLYRLESGRSNGSFGMHVASMCGVAREIVDCAEVAAREWEHTSKLKRVDFGEQTIPLGLQSDVSWIIREKDVGEDGCAVWNEGVRRSGLRSVFAMIEGL